MKTTQYLALVALCLGMSSLATEASAAPPAEDPCMGNPRCFNAGTFLAEIVQVQPSAMGNGARNHSVTFNIRFRNISDRPIILAYHAGSSSGMDNFGNQYGYGRPSTHDTSVKGIGIVDGRSADPQFTLSPGQGRDAVFAIIRFNARAPVGTSFNYNVVIEELRVMADQTHSMQTVRQNSLSFANLTAGSSMAGNLSGQGGATPNPLQVAGQMIDLLKKPAKK